MSAVLIISILFVSALLTILAIAKYLDNQRDPYDGYHQWCREMRAKDPNFVEPYVWMEKNGRMTYVHRSEVDPVYKVEYDKRVAQWRAEATIDPKTL